MKKLNFRKLMGIFGQASKVAPKWNAHLEISGRIQAIGNSRQYLHFQTDILQKTQSLGALNVNSNGLDAKFEVN